MKRLYSLIYFILVAVLALFPLVATSDSSVVSLKADSLQEIYVDSSDEIMEISQNVNSGTNNYSNSKIILKGDLTLSGSWVPIGNVNFPFKGVFDGNGFTVLFENAFINSGDGIADYSYQGLFGYTNGAEIVNLQVKGSYSSNLISSGEVYAGMMVGYAVNTKISGCEVDVYNENFEFVNFNLTGKVTFGSFAGRFDGGEITNCASYYSNHITYSLSNSYNIKIGGIVGSLVNSSLIKVAYFGNIKVQSLDSVSSTQSSKFSIGGIAGEVEGNITKIKDSVIGGQINFINNYFDECSLGSVIGIIITAPQPGNISSVAYVSDSEPFGEQGSYSYVNVGKKDNVMQVSNNILYAQEFYSSSSYSFILNGTTYVFVWNEDTSFWDFDNIWVMSRRNSTDELRLQLFQNFKIYPAGLLDPAGLLTLISDYQDDVEYPYGKEVSINFKFVDDENFKYYIISDILLNGQTLNLSNFSHQENGDMVSQDGEIILTKNADETFSLKVKATNSTQGSFSFRLSAVEFTNYIVAGENGQVRYSGTTSLSSSLTRNLSKESSEIKVEAVGNKQYVFTSWSLYFSSEDGNYEYAGQKWAPAEKSYLENPLSITFGTGDFLDSFLLVANFKNDPCTLSFNFDSNFIDKIDINGSVILKTGESVMLDKNENVVLKVYVKKDSQISEDEIVSNIKKIFIRDTASINTSIYPDGLNQDLTVYEFSFSTASINFETSSSFTLNISGTAKIVEEGGNTTLWIIIGVVGGVVLLGGSALIVWLIIRRKKLGKLKNRNDDYKNYYY